MRPHNLVPAFFFGSPIALLASGGLVRVFSAWTALGCGAAIGIVFGLGVIAALRSTR
jgi:hypothetical protein